MQNVMANTCIQVADAIMDNSKKENSTRHRMKGLIPFTKTYQYQMVLSNDSGQGHTLMHKKILSLSVKKQSCFRHQTK